MPALRPILFALALTLHSAFAEGPAAPAAPLPDAAFIMARVAANQDRADAERIHYVYVQHAHVISRRGKTVMCEETTDSRITPTATGADTQLLTLEGRLLRKQGYLAYTALPTSRDKPDDAGRADHDSVKITVDDDDTDRDLVENMRSNLIRDKSKDGIGAGLFPLTSKTQSELLFDMVGRERINDRYVFHIRFHPKDKDGYGWKGDAYIDATAYQPVVVRTTMARPVPFAVRTLLGTSVPGLGFTVVYQPQPDGMWFPVSFGTEFKLHVLFFFSRQIILDARNHDFEKTHVSSKILAASEAAPQP